MDSGSTDFTVALVPTAMNAGRLDLAVRGGDGARAAQEFAAVGSHLGGRRRTAFGQPGANA